MKIPSIALIGAVLAAAMIAVPGAARAAPATPSFGPAIDAYAGYDGQRTCDASEKPGVAGFRDLLNATYGWHNSGIGRACNDGGQSEHKEGRALDYVLNVNDAGQRAIANDILNWLLATDRHGNTNANARRLGVMYIIWNRQIWYASNPYAGWQNYACSGDPSDCHTNHIHTSFSWAGARKQTSWWHPVTPHDHVSDFSGDGYADVLGVDSGGLLWYYPNNGLQLSPRGQIGHGWGTFKHVMAADYSGDGYADVLGVDSAGQLWYYPNNGLQLSPRGQIGHGWGTFKHVIAADYSGDGHADVLGVDSAGLLWYYPNNGLQLSAPVQIGHGWGTFKHVNAVDFSGDGHADVIGVDSAGLLWYYPNNGLQLSAPVQIGHGWGAFPSVM